MKDIDREVAQNSGDRGTKSGLMEDLEFELLEMSRIWIGRRREKVV